MKSKIKTPLFSIITICYNAEDAIEQTIQSTLEQKFKNFEYIIIDGGSTDGTLKIIKEYSDQIDRLVSEPDRGIYDAMNKGAALAKGEYIYYLNAGDWFCDKNILNEMNVLIEESKADVLFGAIRLVYQNYEVVKNTKFTLKKLRLGKMPPHQGSFFKLKVLKKLHYFNDRYQSSADFDLMTKALKYGVTIKNTGLIIANFSTGGTSSNKNLSYKETYMIIRHRFGTFWATLFKIRKIYLEQGIKKILLWLKLDGVYNYLARLNNQR